MGDHITRLNNRLAATFAMEWDNCTADRAETCVSRLRARIRELQKQRDDGLSPSTLFIRLEEDQRKARARREGGAGPQPAWGRP